MRKIFALAMVAVLALTVAFAVVGCGQKAQETTETTPPAEQTTMPADTGMGAPADTGMSHMGTDTTMHQ